MFDPFRKLVGKETTVKKREREAREREARERQEREAREHQEREIQMREKEKQIEQEQEFQWQTKKQAWQSQFRYDPSIRPCEDAALQGHKEGVSSLAVLPNGQLASGSYDGTIKLWDMTHNECTATLNNNESVYALAILPNDQLASAIYDGTIKFWDVEQTQCVATFELEKIALDLAVLPNGHLASVSFDDYIKIWNIVQGRSVSDLYLASTCRPKVLAVLPNGHLAIGGENGIKLWNAKVGSGASYLGRHTTYAYFACEIKALAVLSNGQLVSASFAEIKLWDVRQGRCVATLEKHTSWVNALTELPNGYLASGSDDKTIKLWDVEQSQCVATLEGHTDSILSLAVLPSGLLASGSGDTTIKLWDIGLRPALKAAARPTFSLPSSAPIVEIKSIDVPPMSSVTTIAISASAASEADDRFDMSDFSKGLESLFIPARDISLGRELGRGGFGIVYEGVHARSETVAVKTYYGTKMPEKELREMQHEVQIMQKLQSRFLVRLLGLVYEESSPTMLVMEYGANGSLYNYLHSNQTITWSLRLRMAEELARGLTYLHHRRIIHRDIKSLNIVLDQEFHAKWCDFGLAVLKLHSTTTSKVATQAAVGTLRWMAPELLVDDHPIFGTSSDIWALGMVFFELASREIPYKDLREQQVMFKIAQGKSETVPADCASPAFGALLQRCWAERTTRPSAADVVDQMTEINRSFVDTPVSVSFEHLSLLLRRVRVTWILVVQRNNHFREVIIMPSLLDIVQDVITIARAIATAIESSLSEKPS